MTCCSYIPPESLSVIAIAKERGGTTDGDVQALRDRFGCKAEATHEIEIGDADEPDELLDACRDHVGHLLGDGGCWVHPIVPIEVAMTIAFGPPVAHAGFGTPMILSPAASATAPIVDLGTNPTREQLEAAGFTGDSPAYREALAAFMPIPTPTPQTVGVARQTIDNLGAIECADDARARIERDRLLYGTGFGRQRPDGTLERIPAPEMIVDHMPTPRTGWGDAIPQRAAAAGSWTSATSYAVGDRVESGGATWQVARAGTALVLSSGNLPLTLYSTIVKPGHDGSSAMLWISAPINASQIAILEDWRRARVPIRVDAESDPYAIVEMTYAGGAHDAWALTLVLKQIWLDRMSVQQQAKMEPANRPTTCPATFGGSMHTYIPGAERCFCGATHPPPYAVGDEVEWRTGPLHVGWTRGRVTSVLDDRPNDGIDKPFWIVRVDTAGERRFASAAVIGTCLRRPTPSDHAALRALRAR